MRTSSAADPAAIADGTGQEIAPASSPPPDPVGIRAGRCVTGTRPKRTNASPAHTPADLGPPGANGVARHAAARQPLRSRLINRPSHRLRHAADRHWRHPWATGAPTNRYAFAPGR